MCVTFLRSLQDVDRHGLVFFVERGHDDGKEDAAAGNVAQDLGQGNVRVREEDVNLEAEVFQTSLDGFGKVALEP